MKWWPRALRVLWIDWQPAMGQVMSAALAWAWRKAKGLAAGARVAVWLAGEWAALVGGTEEGGGWPALGQGHWWGC